MKVGGCTDDPNKRNDMCERTNMKWDTCKCENGTPSTNKLYPEKGATTCPVENLRSCDKCNDGYTRVIDSDGIQSCKKTPLSCEDREIKYQEIKDNKWTLKSASLSTVKKGMPQIPAWWNSDPEQENAYTICGQHDDDGTLKNNACGYGWNSPKGEGVFENAQAYCPIGSCYFEQNTGKTYGKPFSQVCEQPQPYNTEFPSIPALFRNKIRNRGDGDA